jgi:hypothetical protein
LGCHPPPRGSCSMSDDGDGGSDREPALAAAEEYIMGGPWNPLIDVDEDSCPKQHLGVSNDQQICRI